MNNKEIEEAKKETKRVKESIKRIRKISDTNLSRWTGTLVEGNCTYIEWYIEKLLQSHEEQKDTILQQEFVKHKEKLEELEQKNKKVIDKLEEDIERYSKIDNNTLNEGGKWYKQAKIDYAIEILNLVKGEVDE